jgi:DNA-binding NarL/FixJ family response regulator
MITVLIAYDGSLNHFAATTPVQTEPDVWVMGTVTDDSGVIPAVHILEPDVLVFESMRLSLSAVEITHYVTARGLPTRVVIVSTQVEHASLIGALRSGVAGVVLRPFDRAELVHAVREAAAGRYYLSPKLWCTLSAYAERMCDTSTARARLTALGILGCSLQATAVSRPFLPGNN